MYLPLENSNFIVPELVADQVILLSFLDGL